MVIIAADTINVETTNDPGLNLLGSFMVADAGVDMVFVWNVVYVTASFIVIIMGGYLYHVNLWVRL